MRRTRTIFAAVAAAGVLVTSACSTDTPVASSTSAAAGTTAAASEAETTAAATQPASAASVDKTTEAASETATETSDSATAVGDSEWFIKADYDRQLAQRDAAPEGDAATPWLQAIDPEWIDTAEFKQDGPQNLCFSNASTGNPWRATGYVTMQSQIAVLQKQGVIGDYKYSDAADNDEQQITDIQKFISDGTCDALIVSPATTATLTPAVEKACASGIPVIVFDRGVNTDCATTFIHPIGGYAYGADGANFLVDNLEAGKRVLALRIAPGVDVLENRWAAAERIFADSDLTVVGAEFTGGDGAEIKSIVASYLEKG